MIPIRTLFLAICTFLLGTVIGVAQEKTDTTKPRAPLRVASFDENNLHFGNKTVHDTTYYQLDSFQLVHPFLINTGNLGSPGHLLLFPRIEQRDAFSVRPDAFSYFGFDRYNRRFYNTNQPYTVLQYFVGQKQEQYVDVLHARNFGNNLDFSFRFVRARAEGFYNRQQTSNTSVRTNLWYMGPAKRYSLMTDFFWTGANVAENGGLADDSTFTDATQLDRQVNDVNLDLAGTIQRKRGLWMKHTIALGDVTDTLVLDSARSYNVITPAWGFSLVSELSDEKYTYTDGNPTAGFYEIIFRDSVQTSDSTYCWRVNNSLRLEKFNRNGADQIRAFVGVRHEAGEYFNDTIYKHFNNIYAEGSIVYNYGQAFQPFCSKSRRVYHNQIDAGGWYSLSGFNTGDYRFTLNGTVTLGTLWAAAVHGTVSALSPAMIYQVYSGNNLRWENDFQQTHRNSSEIVLTNSGRNYLVEVKGTLTNEEKPLYFDSTFLPAQYDGEISTYSASVLWAWNVSWFNCATRITYSKTSNESIIRLPEVFVQHTMYASLKLFKNKLRMQIGADVIWFSQFTAEAYMPAVAQFYIQNSRMAGNYPYIDPWVSIRVRPVRVFVKVDHANAGLMGRTYFNLAHYPHNDLALKIGISWLFND